MASEDIPTIQEQGVVQEKQILSASPDVSGILKIDKMAASEDLEIEFEIDYQRTLTTQQRFKLMFRKSREIMEVMLRHGYRKPFEIIKRT